MSAKYTLADLINDGGDTSCVDCLSMFQPGPCPKHNYRVRRALDRAPGEMPKDEGVKFDTGKPNMTAIAYHPRALTEIAKVLDHGAQKYGRDNYKKVPQLEQRYPAAIIRHLFAYLRGEKLDPESGLPHLAHAACSILFLLEVEK